MSAFGAAGGLPRKFLIEKLSLQQLEIWQKTVHFRKNNFFWQTQNPESNF
jgi:hypothetical protein